MSQPDLVSRLRETRPAAPAELRERVRLIACEAAVPSRRRITWRRAVVVLVPVAAAIAAAVVLLPGSSSRPVVVPRTFTQGSEPLAPPIIDHTTSGAAATAGAARGAILSGGDLSKVSPISPTSGRLQHYSASLSLEIPTAAGVSDASRRAIAIVASLSGYEQSVVVRTAGKTGYADLVLRVPVGNVRAAIARLSALGRITSENVSLTDLQVQVNTTDTRIASLQRELAALRAQTQTPRTLRQITAITAQVVRLQRARASAIRAAHYATIELDLATPQPKPPVHHKPGPLHGLGTAFRWIGIGAVYGLALGTPFVVLIALAWLVVRGVRRRREDRLLSSR